MTINLWNLVFILRLYLWLLSRYQFAIAEDFFLHIKHRDEAEMALVNMAGTLCLVMVPSYSRTNDPNLGLF